MVVCEGLSTKGGLATSDHYGYRGHAGASVLSAKDYYCRYRASYGSGRL